MKSSLPKARNPRSWERSVLSVNSLEESLIQRMGGYSVAQPTADGDALDRWHHKRAVPDHVTAKAFDVRRICAAHHEYEGSALEDVATWRVLLNGIGRTVD